MARIAHKNAPFTGRMGAYPAVFWLALAANTLFFFSFQTTFPVLPRFIADVVLARPPELVAGQVGLATMMLALVAVLVRIPAGRLIDRLGRQRFMLAGALCFVLAPLIYASSRSMPTLLLGRVVHGVGLGIFTTALQALVAELAPAGRRGAALGLAGASTSVAFMSAPLAGDWLALNKGYALLFQVNAVAAALCVVMVVLLTLGPRLRRGSPGDCFGAAMSLSPLRTRPRDDAPRSDGGEAAALDSGEGQSAVHQPAAGDAGGFRLAWSQTGVRAGVLTMAALGVPFGAFLTFLPLFADERQITGVGLVYSVYAGTILLAQPLAGWFADRVGRLGVILPGLLITGLAAAVPSVDGSLAWLTLCGIVFGLGGGLVRGGVDPLVQDSVPATLRGTAAALQYTSFDFWIGAGSYPLGLLAGALGYAVMFVVTGVVCVLVGAGLAVMLRRARGNQRISTG